MNKKCKHKKWQWKTFDCIVVCDGCEAWHNCSVSQGASGYEIELHGKKGWVKWKPNGRVASN